MLLRTERDRQGSQSDVVIAVIHGHQPEGTTMTAEALLGQNVSAPGAPNAIQPSGRTQRGTRANLEGGALRDAWLPVEAGHGI
jgi:hypothetical protein